MKTMLRNGLRAGMLAAVALLAFHGSARGEVLLRENYGGAAAGKEQREAGALRHGKGWRPAVGGDTRGSDTSLLLYPVARNMRAGRGTVELVVVRDRNPEGLENYFSLATEDGRSLVNVRIWWKGRTPYDGPVLEINGEDAAIGKLWFTEHRKPKSRGTKVLSGMPLPRAVGIGEEFNITFTWGPRAADCVVYFDGRRLPAKVKAPFGMSEYIEAASKIVVGGHPRPGWIGAYVQPTSFIKGVYIYDEVIDGRDLYQHPQKYRPAGAPVPEIESVNHNAARVAGFSGKLVAGNTVGVTLRGDAGAAGSFDIVPVPGIDGKIALDWKGWGVYLEEKVFFEPGEVNLRDVAGYEVYGSEELFDPAAPGMEPVARLEVEEQAYTFEFLPVGKPYYAAVVARMRDGSGRLVFDPIWNQPLAEEEPGVYRGRYRVGWQDRYAEAVVVGRLANGRRAATIVDDKPFGLDPALNVAVAAAPNELKADEKSTAKVTVQVTNANGDAVAGHKIRFLLATTSQYTGVVGGGAFAEQVGGSITESFRGETDLFGRITATYVAGFAAKTAVIVARDMLSNSTGAAYVKTFIQAGAQLELEPVRPTEAMMAGYEIEVTSSDDWLTADGKSEARISAKVTLNGQPVEGHAVRFGVSAGTGTIRTVKETTGKDGVARAVYTAGKKIGLVVITATDTTVDISGTVQIELRSDAPAKIAIKIDPEKLPADGRSTADLRVLVTDINDNPNDNTEVEYRIAAGGGELREQRTLTDRNGETTNEYEAGRAPGIVTFELTVRSTVPTEEELAKARGLALAVTDYDFY